MYSPPKMCVTPTLHDNRVDDNRAITAFLFMLASSTSDEKKPTTRIGGCAIRENAIPRVTFSVPNFS